MGMEIKYEQGGVEYEHEPYIPVTLDDGSVVRGNAPDFIVAGLVINELKAHFYTMSKDNIAQIIGYLAALPHCPVAIYLNFGRPRLEYHRLFPPTTVQAYQREKWGRVQRNG
jgi:GxxExxY protein